MFLRISFKKKCKEFFNSILIKEFSDLNYWKAHKHIKLVKEWAADVWNAYAVNHDLAKNWIKVAMT